MPELYIIKTNGNLFYSVRNNIILVKYLNILIGSE